MRDLRITTREGLAPKRNFLSKALSRISYEVRFHIRRLTPEEVEQGKKWEYINAACEKAGAKMQVTGRGRAVSSDFRPTRYRFINPDTGKSIYPG